MIIDQELEAAIYRRVAGKSEAIIKMGISPTITAEARDEIIKTRAEAKAEELGNKWQDNVKGQRWYIEDLITYSGLDLKERKEAERKAVFPDIASSEQMDESLEEILSRQAS